MLSVIIPVYNVAAYLPACLDSVLAQSFTGFELLLVDDGSTDGSADLCDDYACRDARVTVLHQANAGPAAARNAALSVAQGEFVTFVDADDVVHRDYLATLLRHLTSAPDVDVVQVAHRQLPAHERAAITSQRLSAPLPAGTSRSLTGQEALLAMLYQRDAVESAPWGKLFRRECFEGLRFPAAFRVYEDLYLLAQLLPRVRRMECVDVPVYFYFKQPSGTLCSLSTERRDAFDVLQTLEAQYMVTGQKPLIRAARERRFAVAMNILRLLSRLPHTSQHVAMAHLCWQHIVTLRTESLHDPHARLKNRLAALASYLIKRG